MKRFLIVNLLLITVIGSCKKNDIGTGNTRDDDGNGNINRSLRVKSDGYTTYEYDSKGRLSSMTSSTGYWDYYYSDSIVTEIESTPLGIIAAVNIYKLNSNGLVYLKQLSGYVQNLYTTFEYSATRALIKHTEVLLQNPGDIIYYYYRTGNRLDSVTWAYGNVTETRIYEYEPGRVNTVNNESTGRSFLGLSSPNPVKRELVRINRNPPGVAVSYTYEFDSQNRISKRIATRPNFPDEERVFTYY